ncbi:hypothetical protein VQ643_11300 [Pseudomonas sp. F1_0610]|uniref:immunity protein TriTu family protein n=1 Tax=Pseudomonas sp. F1_0610 TaxID=3114284 RepID=UPI0039C3924E
MLKAFYYWAKKQFPRVEISFQQQEEVSSCVLNYDLEHYLARFTIWDDFSCVCEVLSVRDETNLLTARYELENLDQAQDALLAFDQYLGALKALV